MPRRNFSWFWLIPLLLVSFWLGAYGLHLDALWGDEYFSVATIGWPTRGLRTPVEIWTYLATNDPSHVPGYFFILNAWTRLVGWHPPAMRALSLFVGMLALAWTYRLGREQLSSRAGLYAAIVLSTSALFVFYLHELRMYSTVALLTVVTLWAYLRLVRMRRMPGFVDWFALFIGTLGLLYLHYFAALLLIVIGLYHLLFVRKDRRWWQVAGVMALAGACFIPWLRALLTGINLAMNVPAAHNEQAFNADQVVETMISLFSNGMSVLFVVGVLPALVARGSKAWTIWFFSLALLALFLLVNSAFEIFLPPTIRYLIPLWPLFALLIGLGLTQLGRVHWRGLAMGQITAGGILALWFALGLWNSVNFHGGVTSILDGTADAFPMHEARELLLARVQPEDAVVSYLPDTLGNWMYGGIDHFYYGDLRVASILMENKDHEGRQERQAEEAMSVIGDRPRVWLAYDPNPEPMTLADFKDVLSEEYNMCGAVSQESSLRIELFARSPVCCAPEMNAAEPVAQFGDGITLTGIDLATAQQETLPVTLGWAVDADVPLNSYSVALHVVDSSETLVAQGDYGLASQAFSCQQTPIDISSLPAGEYTLRVGVYEWGTGERLRGTLLESGVQGDLLPVGDFTVG